MLTRAQKEAIVGDLKQNIENAKAIFRTSLIGLDSNSATAVRKSVREAKGTIVITRNTLIELAAKGTKAEELLSNLKGTNAVALAFDEAPAVAKAIYDANREHEDLVILDQGLLEDKLLSKAEVIELAKLPSREQMLATLLATFQAPVSAFARTLEAIRAKKEEEGGAPAVSDSATPVETTTEDKTEE